jgi:hypothetical protein
MWELKTTALSLGAGAGGARGELAHEQIFIAPCVQVGGEAVSTLGAATSPLENLVGWSSRFLLLP